MPSRGSGAERFVGTGQNRSQPAWQQVYRALDHGFAKNACFQAANLGFPDDVTTFAEIFARLQDERHRADYDPETRYSRADIQTFIRSLRGSCGCQQLAAG